LNDPVFVADVSERSRELEKVDIVAQPFIFLAGCVCLIDDVRRVRLLKRSKVVPQTRQLAVRVAHGPELALKVACSFGPELRHNIYRFKRHPPVLPIADVECE
jgi:hypothetical protein